MIKKQQQKRSRKLSIDCKTLLANLPGHVYWLDRNNVFLGCNEQQAKTIGFSSSKEIIGRTIPEFNTKENAEHILKVNNLVMSKGIPQIVEEPFLKLDGNTAIFLSHKVPLRNKRGKIVGLLGISFDITDIKEYESFLLLLSQDEAKIILKNIVSSLPGHVYWKDKNGVFLGCNDLQAKSFGLKSAKDLIGKTDHDFSARKMADEIRRNDLRIMQSGVPETIEEPADYGGKSQIFLSQKRPLLDMERNIIGVIGVSFDITAQKKQEQRMKKALKRAEDAKKAIAKLKYEITGQKANLNNSLEDYIEDVRNYYESILAKMPGHIFWMDKYNRVLGCNKLQARDAGLKSRKEMIGKTMKSLGGAVAHELRTPLSSIVSVSFGITQFLPKLIDAYQIASKAKLIADDIFPQHLANLSKGLGIIERETNFANTVIDMLLMNIKANEMNPKEFELCSISNCVKNAIDRYPFLGEEEKLIHYDENNSFTFNGKSLLIIHILFNLLKNALYYIAKAKKGEISIWFETGKTLNELHFKDTGTGIAPDVLPKIFEPFFSKTHNGTGIGLSFCKMVMYRLQGNIVCQSKEGEFAEFILSFPLTEEV